MIDDIGECSQSVSNPDRTKQHLDQNTTIGTGKFTNTTRYLKIYAAAAALSLSNYYLPGISVQETKTRILYQMLHKRFLQMSKLILKTNMQEKLNMATK